MASGKKNYFRHSFQAHRDQKLIQIIEKFGMSGYAYFWIILELCGEQSEDSIPEKFVFHQRLLLQSLLVRKDKLHNYLTVTTQLRLIHATISGTMIELHIPNFAKYLGKYTNKNASNVSNKRKEKKRKEKESKDTESVNQDKNKCDAKKANNEKIISVIDYLNAATGKKLKPLAKANSSFINARLNEGYAVEDLKKVIDIKCREWIGTDMAKYLRSATLFNSEKFDDYLNESEILKPEDLMERFIIDTEKRLGGQIDEQPNK